MSRRFLLLSYLCQEPVQFLPRASQNNLLSFLSQRISQNLKNPFLHLRSREVLESLDPLPKLELITEIQFSCDPGILIPSLTRKHVLEPIAQKLAQTEALDSITSAEEGGAAQQRDRLNTVERLVDGVELLRGQAETDGCD